MERWIVENRNGKFFSLPTKIVKPKYLRHLSPLAWKILKALAQEPSYPKELARKLKIHEQKIYYHVRNLKKAGLIKVVKEERIHGVLAKYYEIEKPSIALTLTEMESVHKLFALKKEYENFLYPFIDNGKLNALFILGSTEPHGVMGARARDISSGTNLALFFGSFLNYIPKPKVKLDTEVRGPDLNDNLIVIGGPGINRIMKAINDKLPIRFRKKQDFYHSVYSSVSKKNYSEETQGIVVKTENPFSKNKYILAIAGRRYAGTEACVLAFLYKFDEVCRGNDYNPKIKAKVVRGYDLNGDGIIDTAEILE